MPILPLSRIPSFWAAQLGPDAPALVHGDETVSWGELDRASSAIAAGLKQRGVGPDEFVTLALPNCGDLYKMTFALWKLGAIPHIVSWKLPQAELKAILELLQPKLLVTEAVEINQAFGGVTPGSLAGDADALIPEAIATFWKAMSSGGSTGRPKIIVDHTPATADTERGSMFLPKNGVVLNPGPTYHNGPFLFTHTALFQGSTVVGMTKFDAEQTLRLIDARKVQWISMVPTMMARIWRLPAGTRNAYDLSSLKVIWHMAAPMPVWLKEAWIDWVGPERIWELYGGTERVGSSIISGTEWLTHKGSVGRPNPDCVVHIRDDNGNDLPSGSVGEIFLKQKSGVDTYHYIGADGRKSDDGFQSIGDFGWLDDDGYLYLADRRTDLILTGGANVYPAEVEGALMEHPGVDTAVVVGIPHEDLGAAVHAIIRPRPEWALTLKPDLLAVFVREKLALYKTPRTYEFTQEDLRDDAGKVRRSKLREEALAGLTAKNFT